MAGLTGGKQVIVMPMAGIHGPGRRGKGRSRTTAAVLISATVVLAVLVGVGVVAFLHSTSSSSSAQGRQLRLSNKITSQQTVGLANLGRTGQAGSSGSSSTLLSGGAGGVVFTPSSGGESVQSSQQWQADEMGSGGFVLLFSGSHQCLTVVGNGAQATLQLARCDTALNQRWYHPFQGTDSQGRDYWQLRSASSGRCLGLSNASSSGSVVPDLQKCSAAKPWAQLIMFWSVF
jgi:Ricin-type beta-trefoil lectin domain-like